MIPDLLVESIVQINIEDKVLRPPAAIHVFLKQFATQRIFRWSLYGWISVRTLAGLISTYISRTIS